MNNAQTEVIPPAKIVPFKPFKGDLGELVHDRVKLNPETSSATLDPKTTIEEFVPIMGSFIQMEKKTGFVIGDLYNQGFDIYGAAMNQAMSQFGLAPSTIEVYARISKKVLPSQRLGNLTFSHYQVSEPLLTENKSKALEVLKDAATGGEVEKGEAPKPVTVAEMKRIVKASVTPKPKKENAKKPGRTAKPKAIKAPKPAKYRDMLAEEKGEWVGLKKMLPKLDEILTSVLKTLRAIPSKKDGKGITLFDAISQADIKERREFVKECPNKNDLSAMFKFAQQMEDKA